MKKNMNIIACLLIMFGLLIPLTACGSGESDLGVTEVHIGYFPNITHSQALVMKNQETLENLWEGKCVVTWTSFNAGPAEVEAIFAGEIDLGYIGPVPALNANVKSEGEVKIIANSTNAGAVLLVRKDSAIDSIEDLKGKKVAIPQLGNTQHLCLLNILTENKIDGVEIKASSNADILNLIDNGSVDAALVPEPWGTTIEKNGSAEVLLDDKQVFLDGNYPTAVVVARKEFMEEYPDLVEDFLRAHEDATLYINENKENAQKIVNKEIQGITGKALEPDVIQNAFLRMEVSTEINIDAVMKFAQISMDEGFISIIPEEENVFAVKFR